MRRVLVILGIVLVAVLVVGTAGAKPHGGAEAPPTVPVTGTYTALGIGAPFAGTLTVDRFGEADGQLVVEGVLAADDGLFEAAAVTVVAVAAPSADPVTGDCTVEVGMVSTIPVGDAFVTLADPTFELGGPGSGSALCGVVKAAEKDPSDQGAIARALNRAIGLA